MSGPTNESDDEQHVNKENTTPPDMSMSPSNAASANKQSSTVPEVRESMIGTILRVGDVSFLLDPETLQKLNSDILNQKIADAKAAAVVGAPAAASLDAGNGGPPKSSPRQQQGGSNTSSPQRRTLLSNASEDASPSTIVVVVEGADAECFSALLHMARFGSLPTSIFNKDKRQLLLQQAESVWGVRPQVEDALDKAREEFRKSCDCVDAIHSCLMMIPLSSKPPVFGSGGRTPDGCQKSPALAVPPATVATRANSARNRSSSTASSSSYGSSLPPGAAAVCLGGPHHNFRRDDGSRRVFCSSCGHRDIDWRYHVGDYYANCDKCFKEVTYKPNLGWCHKCRQCDTCQTLECPGVPIRQLEEQVIPYMMATLKQNELTFF